MFIVAELASELEKVLVLDVTDVVLLIAEKQICQDYIRMMIITFSSPLTDDRGDQGPVLVVIHAGVAGRPREALHLV